MATTLSTTKQFVQVCIAIQQFLNGLIRQQMRSSHWICEHKLWNSHTIVHQLHNIWVDVCEQAHVSGHSSCPRSKKYDLPEGVRMHLLGLLSIACI